MKLSLSLVRNIGLVNFLRKLGRVKNHPAFFLLAA
jgi:hypothetical protein